MTDIGYRNNFLGDDFTVSLPSFAPELHEFILERSALAENEAGANVVAHYQNYSVVMNRVLKTPVYAALNIDQNQLKSVRRTNNWRIDTRIGAEHQLNNEYYRDQENIVLDETGDRETSFKNPYDRGHLARRAAAAWGANNRQAKHASDDTFYFSNAALQHGNFNQDEWLALEDWVKNLNLDSTGRLSVFTGPIFGPLSRSITPVGRQTALIPAAFFKVVAFINNDNKLDARAFIMAQDVEAIRDRRGRRMFDFQRYQVSVTEIEEATGLRFDAGIPDANPLYFNDDPDARENRNVSHFPERIEVDTPVEMINSAHESRRFIRDDSVSVYIAAALVNPSGNERKNEWVSVLNLSSDDVDLANWQLADTHQRAMTLDGKLRPGESKIFNPIKPVILANTGGTIMLLDDNGNRIDRVKYTKAMAKTDQVAVFSNRYNDN